MGQQKSKHVCRREGPEGECFLINHHIQGIDFSDQLSEVSLCFDTSRFGMAEDRYPLKVLLPPSKGDTSMAKVLNMDNSFDLKVPLLDSETTDNNIHTDHSGINVEEFECGVSVEGSDKQEWSFTLYDFDGRGQVTKEDLASLMKSLYDAVGTSIAVPQQGMKTLKLRLTVSPDSTKPKGGKKLNKDSIKESKTEKEAKSHSKQNKDRDNNSRLSKESIKENNLVKAERMNGDVMRKEVSPSSTFANNLSGSPTKPEKTKLTSFEQKHLAELIQKNMERHQQKQQQIRRHHSDRHSRHHSHHHHHHNNSWPHHEPKAQECPDRRKYYLDLAGIENHQTSKLNTSAPAVVLNNQTGHDHEHRNRRSSHNKESRSKSQLKSDQNNDSKPIRAKSHEPKVKVENSTEQAAEQHMKTLEEQCEEDVQDRVVTKSSPESPQASPIRSPPGTQINMQSTPKPHKYRPVSLPAPIPEAVSPHHHRRHRNREKNRTLAMKNVADWIERNCGTEHVIIQRHEHHHVHEHHHHHHYHHYHET